ncbi:hypothetical protein [Pontibacter akesuensis]|uniref:Uncharacterized protein n=1 Tax=Pontibacter akesuensis TaxID=388950 RepID=A0A1I7G312_9BACT|nr:hypothetical protein [Pontibacter akesuensis]SFU42819.1 hypothetical protein SAMN04487941_0674 [Pontibacter akesuensis]
MKPEDIDKIFKERLGNSTPTPPADMWARLQERMEEETPAMGVVREHQESQPQKNSSRRFMWLYSSVAATLSLLLAVSVVFYNINTGTPEINAALTQHDPQLVEEQQPVVKPDALPNAELLAQQKAEVERTAEASKETEKNLAAQATASHTSASNITKAPVIKESLAKASPKAVQQPKMASAPVNKVSKKATAQQAIAANSTPVEPATAVSAVSAPEPKPGTPIATSVAKSSANLNAEPVEIIIKRAVAPQTAMAEETTTPDAPNTKVKLAKNIFKQVRNLASGEEVELSALGIRADRLALETQIGKQKISKVINL